MSNDSNNIAIDIGITDNRNCSTNNIDIDIDQDNREIVKSFKDLIESRLAKNVASKYSEQIVNCLIKSSSNGYSAFDAKEEDCEYLCEYLKNLGFSASIRRTPIINIDKVEINLQKNDALYKEYLATHLDQEVRQYMGNKK
mgnify:CR=1 FL=1